MPPGHPTYPTVAALADGPLGAYLHVPFCTKLCPFCPYNKVVPRAGQTHRYFADLAAEVQGYLDAGTSSEGFTSLYVGGGTPTLFPELLRPVVTAIPVSGERAIEVLPSHATPRRLDTLADMGFDAVSVGVQSLSDEVLQHLERPHDAAQARAAVQAALERFALVDVDLILDVAYDSERAFLDDLEWCFAVGVHQVSTYPLMRFGYTPFGPAKHERRREHAVLAAATELAGRYGFERRSVWTFNRPDSASYTSITRRRFLGFGAGASSFLGRDFLVNHFALDAYADAVEAGRPPVARQFHLGPLGRTYEAFWQAYSGSVDAAPGGLSRWLHQAAVGSGVALGWLSPTADSHRLTPRGLDRYHDLERWVTYHLIEPLWAEMLAEHGSDDSWATPNTTRSNRLWRVLTRVLERPC